MFVRSARLASDGKPILQGVGARLIRRGGVRVDLAQVGEPLRAGRLRLTLHSGDRVERVTVRNPKLTPAGAYRNVTLEAAS